LGQTRPFFHRLVATLVREMGAYYTELVNGEPRATQVLLQEEERFAETLATGMALLDAEATKLTSTVIPGETVFRLYDTYGFPLDLTADVARERGLTIDQAGFDAAMEAQRDRARAASKFGSELRDTVTLPGRTEFLGYDRLCDRGVVTSLIFDGAVVDVLRPGQEGQVVLDHTPFYAESGGQIGDAGVLEEALRDGGVVGVELHRDEVRVFWRRADRAQGRVTAVRPQLDLSTARIAWRRGLVETADLRARAGVARHAGGAAIDATAAARSAVRVRRARVAVAGWIAASRARPFGARGAGASRPARPSRGTASRGSARRPARRRPARRRPVRRVAAGIARRAAPAVAVLPAVAGSRAVHGGAAAAARSRAAAAAPGAGRRLPRVDGPVVARASPFHDARAVARRREAAARASLGARAQKDEPGWHHGADSHDARCIGRLDRSRRRSERVRATVDTWLTPKTPPR